MSDDNYPVFNTWQPEEELPESIITLIGELIERDTGERTNPRVASFTHAQASDDGRRNPIIWLVKRKK